MANQISIRSRITSLQRPLCCQFPSGAGCVDRCELGPWSTKRDSIIAVLDFTLEVFSILHRCILICTSAWPYIKLHQPSMSFLISLSQPTLDYFATSSGVFQPKNPV